MEIVQQKVPQSFIHHQSPQSLQSPPPPSRSMNTEESALTPLSMEPQKAGQGWGCGIDTNVEVDGIAPWKTMKSSTNGGVFHFHVLGGRWSQRRGHSTSRYKYHIRISPYHLHAFLGTSSVPESDCGVGVPRWSSKLPRQVNLPNLCPEPPDSRLVPCSCSNGHVDMLNLTPWPEWQPFQIQHLLPGTSRASRCAPCAARLLPRTPGFFVWRPRS